MLTKPKNTLNGEYAQHEVEKEYRLRELDKLLNDLPAAERQQIENDIRSSRRFNQENGRTSTTPDMATQPESVCIAVMILYTVPDL